MSGSAVTLRRSTNSSPAGVAATATRRSWPTISSGSDLGDAYPEVAICEVCGRAVDWPNGIPTLHGQEPE
jgi:hypothetical protein